VFFGSNERTSNDASQDGSDDSPRESKPSREGSFRDPRSYRSNKTSGNRDHSREVQARSEETAWNTYGMDVGNELELLDFVDEEEKREIELRFFVDHALPKMVYVPDDGTQETGHCELSAANVALHNANIGILKQKEN